MKIFKLFIKLISFLFGILFLGYGLTSLYVMTVNATSSPVNIFISVLYIIVGILLIVFIFKWERKFRI